MIDVSQTQSPIVSLAAPPPGDGPPPDLTDVAFITARDGFGVTDGGGIYRTADAGASWVRVFQRDGTRLTQVAFSDAANGMALGRAGCLPGPNCTGPTTLVRTGDGGNTWQSVQPETPTRAIADALPWLAVAVVSSQVSYAVRDPDQNGAPIAGLDGGMIATDDGGAHWRSVSLPPGFTTSGGLSFLSPTQGYVTGWRSDTNAAQILATDDGGRNWRVLYADPGFPLRSVQFLDPQHGFAGGGWGGKPGEGMPPPEALVATDDGGVTWHTVYRRDNVRGGQPITRLHFVSPTTGWSALGGCNSLGANGPCGGTLRFTADGGRTWRPDPSWGERANVVRFSSVGAAAWVVGEQGQPGFGGPTVLYRTMDGGVSWQTFWHPAALVVDRVQFVSPQMGWIDTNAGVFQTVDGGLHWAPYTLGAPVVMEDRPVFASPTVVLAFHGHDALLDPMRDPYRDLLRSDDGGRTWQPAPLVLPAHVEIGSPSLAFAGPEHGWLSLFVGCGSFDCPSVVFATDDGGRSWQQRGGMLPISPATLAFGDEQHGAVVGVGPRSMHHLLLTNDGGRTWSEQPLPDVRLASTQRGNDPPSAPSVIGAGGGPQGSIWVAGTLGPGSGGALFHSDDAGQHWAVSRLDTVVPAQVHFVTPADGWLIAVVPGNAGALLVTHDGGQRWQQVWPVVTA